METSKTEQACIIALLILIVIVICVIVNNTNTINNACIKLHQDRGIETKYEVFGYCYVYVNDTWWRIRDIRDIAIIEALLEMRQKYYE